MSLSVKLHTPLLLVLSALAPSVARADLSLTDFKATVVEVKPGVADVTYEAGVCDSSTGTPTLGIYYHLSSPPVAGTPKPDQSKATTGGAGTCPPTQIVRASSPIGLYQSYAMIDPENAISEPNEGNNVAGPIEVCVGPDLVITSFSVEINGAAVTYKATVCNKGTMAGRKFRVGFWHDRAAEPAAVEMGDIFKAIALLDAGKCEDIVLPAGLRPNGSFKAWCRADSGAFAEECREGNNGFDPLPYSLSNPDLQIASFEAKVVGSQVTYTAKVCNKGTANVTKFYVDVYYDRPKLPPVLGEPGDVAKPVLNLAAGDCTTLSYDRASAPKGTQISFVFADPDDFISEPNEANNLSSPLQVVVGEGPTPPPTGECVDNDKDGHGVGPDCVGVPDCNDNDASINPGVKEICGDKLDNDCDLTPDDGCPGVDCVDGDGDGVGVGADCVLADCDDKNKAVFPWAKEICGNNKDENCDKIADDSCTGRQCVDQDMDGYGVGAGCPGPQDCLDTNFFSNPGAKEVCGDGKDNDCDGVADDGCATAVDADGDGYPVGTPKPGFPSDCNDGDPTVHPGAKELCDGKDQNCNGTVDEGCPGVDCKDLDGDGWPAGKACKVQDCNDADGAIHPFAVEVCSDGKDQNCNGAIDEGCPGVDCKDGDNDGWPAGKACGTSQDCNDSDGGVNPWRPEICADGKDQNCNGAIDEGCPLCEDKDADGHGIGPQCMGWDCDEADPKTYPGAPEICDKKDNNCDGVVDEGCVGGDEGGGCGCRVQTATAEGQGTLVLWGLLAVLLLGARRRRRP